MSSGSVALRAVLLMGFVAAAAAGLAGLLTLAGASFAAPLWLHLAWLAPALVLFDALATWRRTRLRNRLGDPAAVASLVETRLVGVRATKCAAASLAVLLLAISTARPQWGTTQEVVKRRGVDLYACVDTSRSMLAEDARPNRMTRARLALGSLLDRLEGDRVGIIAFAGEARLACPLTLDRAAARLFLDTIEPGMLQRPGTAIGPALRLALRSLQASSHRQGVVVLITDGEDHGGDAAEAASELAASGVVVHVIGIGEPVGTPLPITENDGRGMPTRSFVKDEDGSVVMSKLDESVLQEIATATNGSYQRLSPSEIELGNIAARIRSMQQNDASSRTTEVRTERYAWFLLAAFLLLLLEAALPDGAPLWGSGKLSRATRIAVLRASEGRRQALRKSA